MLQTPAYDTYPHNVASYPGPGSQNSRMTPQRWMYGRSWRMLDQMSTRRLPLCMASQIWGVCWGGWRRYQKRRRNVKVSWLVKGKSVFRYELKILSVLVSSLLWPVFSKLLQKNWTQHIRWIKVERSAWWSTWQTPQLSWSGTRTDKKSDPLPSTWQTVFQSMLCLALFKNTHMKHFLRKKCFMCFIALLYQFSGIMFWFCDLLKSTMVHIFYTTQIQSTFFLFFIDLLKFKHIWQVRDITMSFTLFLICNQSNHL